ECSLQHRECSLIAEALDRRDLTALRLDGEQDARERRAAVQEHRAGSAGALLAGDLRARQTDLLAQELRQGRPFRNRRALLAPVQLERHLAHASTVSACAALSSRNTRPRPTRSGGAPGTSVAA